MTVVGIITSLRRMKTKKGDRMAFAALEDLTGHAEVVVFPKVFETCEAFMDVDAALCIKGTTETESDPPKILAEEIQPLIQAEKDAAAGLIVQLPHGLDENGLDDLLGRTDDVLVEHPGQCPVSFQVPVPSVGEVTVRAGQRFSVTPDAPLIASLEELVGRGRVSLRYR